MMIGQCLHVMGVALFNWWLEGGSDCGGGGCCCGGGEEVEGREGDSGSVWWQSEGRGKEGFDYGERL